MKTKPVRLQLSRKHGFNLQKLSLETNGLPAVNVARPTRWGNPFAVGSLVCNAQLTEIRQIKDRAIAVQCFKAMLPFSLENIRTELRGKNLACWCPLGDPCHADVLLKLANT